MVTLALALLWTQVSHALTLTSDSLKTEMTQFIQTSQPNRTAGTTGHHAAYQYLKKEFEKIAKAHDGKVFEHEFKPDVDYAARNYAKDFATQIEGKIPKNDPEYLRWKRFTDSSIAFVKSFAQTSGKNLILEFKGKTKPTEVIYVGAHYDTITHNKDTMAFTPEKPAPGADDNASGVFAMLSIARQLAHKKHERTIRFVAFDFEEIFFLGSYALGKDIQARRLPFQSLTEKTLGLYNFEMLGYTKTPIDEQPVVKIYTRKPEQKGAQEDLIMAEHLKKAGVASQVPLKLTVLRNGFDRSDHWSFWMNGLPAVCITQDWENQFNESRYHTDQDLPGEVNFNYLLFTIAAAMRAIETHASAP
jgi:hypothetical protein